MKKKTQAEMQRAAVAKTTRTLVRLKHSLAADEEINNRLPKTLEAFDSAHSAGELKELTASINDVLGG